MSKDISKILTKGSARQRIVLLSTDSLQEYLAEIRIKPDAKPILTPGEKENLFKSFKTPAEIKLYNKYAKINRNLPYLLMILRETQLNYNEAIAYLIGLTISWKDYEFTEQTFNRILYEIKEKKLKNKIKKIILNESPFTYADVEKNSKGSIELVTSSDEKRLRLEGIIKVWSGKAEIILIEAKSYIKAIRDYLTEEDFLIQIFKESLNYYEKEFQKDRALIGKYSKRQMDELRKSLKDDKLTTEKKFEKYFVFPDYDELKIDEKAYNTIREGLKKE